jgi:hypothetical protein
MQLPSGACLSRLVTVCEVKFIHKAHARILDSGEQALVSKQVSACMWVRCNCFDRGLGRALKRVHDAS